MRHFATAVVAALVCGCASHYAAPTSGPTATLTLSASSLGPGSWLLVQNFENDACAPSANGTRLATFTTTSVQGKGDPHNGVARAVPAGRPVVVSFVYQAGASGFTDTQSCVVTQSFVPVAGARYRAAFEILQAQCGVFVLREDGGDPKAVDALHQVTPACNNGTSG